MAKRYKLTSESVLCFGVKLFRIEALVEFKTLGGAMVKAGEKGGFIESEENLHQNGNCWVFSGKIWGNAIINGNALISGNAMISGGSIGGDALISGGKIWGDAMVSGKARISGGKIWGNALISGNAVVSGGSIGGDAELTKKCIYIDFAPFWSITVSDKHIRIGCQQHTIDSWSNFSDAEINKMNANALEWWKKWKEFIFMSIKLCEK